MTDVKRDRGGLDQDVAIAASERGGILDRVPWGLDSGVSENDSKVFGLNS